MPPITISPLEQHRLNSFFESFSFSVDSRHIQEYIGLLQESANCYQTIIHEAYDVAEDKVFGFTALRTTHEDIEGVPGILVDFLYLRPEYRKKSEGHAHIKYSFLILDYIIETAIKIQKQVAINHVYLVPIHDKVREIYSAYGFENIPGSGKNEYEDYMVFNLLDEDPTIL